MENDIKVSVGLTSYKHAKYIRKCLDSILEQEVNFGYEIVVGEDCSNDGTREILLEYKEKYPDVFVLLLNEENMGSTRNSYNVACHMRGQYVCSGESDDFWLDKHRMQKQADFLDAHPEVSAVAGNYCSVDDYGENPKVVLAPKMLGRYYTLKDFLNRGMVLQGNTIMRRNSAIPVHEEKYRKMRTAETSMGDVINRVLLYDSGSIYAMPDMFLAHRVSYSGGTSYTEQQKTKMLEYSYMYCRIVDNVSAYLDHKYDLSELKANRTGGMIMLMLMGKRKIDRKQLREYLASLPPKVRTMAYGKVVVKLFRKIKKRLSIIFSGIQVDELT